MIWTAIVFASFLVWLAWVLIRRFDERSDLLADELRRIQGERNAYVASRKVRIVEIEGSDYIAEDSEGGLLCYDPRAFDFGLKESDFADSLGYVLSGFGDPFQGNLRRARAFRWQPPAPVMVVVRGRIVSRSSPRSGARPEASWPRTGRRIGLGWLCVLVSLVAIVAATTGLSFGLQSRIPLGLVLCGLVLASGAGVVAWRRHSR